jgi:hypothetical protein
MIGAFPTLVPPGPKSRARQQLQQQSHPIQSSIIQPPSSSSSSKKNGTTTPKFPDVKQTRMSLIEDIQALQREFEGNSSVKTDEDDYHYVSPYDKAAMQNNAKKSSKKQVLNKEHLAHNVDMSGDGTTTSKNGKKKKVMMKNSTLVEKEEEDVKEEDDDDGLADDDDDDADDDDMEGDKKSKKTSKEGDKQTKKRSRGKGLSDALYLKNKKAADNNIGCGRPPSPLPIRAAPDAFSKLRMPATTGSADSHAVTFAIYIHVRTLILSFINIFIYYILQVALPRAIIYKDVKRAISNEVLELKGIICMQNICAVCLFRHSHLPSLKAHY